MGRVYTSAAGGDCGYHDPDWVSKLDVPELRGRWRLQLSAEQGKQQLAGELQHLVGEERLLTEVVRCTCRGLGRE